MCSKFRYNNSLVLKNTTIWSCKYIFICEQVIKLRFWCKNNKRQHFYLATEFTRRKFDEVSGAMLEMPKVVNVAELKIVLLTIYMEFIDRAIV